MITGKTPAPRIRAVLETGLYVEDLGRASAFYEEVLGLMPMFRDGRLVVYPVGPSVLLLFRKGTTDEPAQVPGGIIPAHAAEGRMHYAFASDADQLEAWRARLAAHGVALESEVAWPRGSVSLYFRDPDGHLLEFATPGLWANY